MCRVSPHRKARNEKKKKKRNVWEKPCSVATCERRRRMKEEAVNQTKRVLCIQGARLSICMGGGATEAWTDRACSPCLKSELLLVSFCPWSCCYFSFSYQKIYCNQTCRLNSANIFLSSTHSIWKGHSEVIPFFLMFDLISRLVPRPRQLG